MNVDCSAVCSQGLQLLTAIDHCISFTLPGQSLLYVPVLLYLKDQLLYSYLPLFFSTSVTESAIFEKQLDLYSVL